jgi:outer membrane receptor protein involved in Fe transport
MAIPQQKFDGIPVPPIWGVLLMVFSLLPAGSIAAGQELDEVVVTATRVAEDINKVPVSITAFTEAQLIDRHLVGMDDLAMVTPGLQFHTTSPNVTEISIRGIQSNIGDATTGIYIDDTPIQIRKAGLSFTATNTYPQLFDIDRVEFLRGPQGTLFGSGSMGGAVRFITTPASLTDSGLYARAEESYANHGDPNMEADFAAGAPLIEDKLAFRISVRYRHDGGYIDQEPRADLIAAQSRSGDVATAGAATDSNSDNAASVRLALTYVPIEALHITPSIYWQDYTANASGQYWDYFSRPSQGLFINGDGVNSPFHDRWSLPALNVRYEFSRFSIISNTSYFDHFNTNYYDCTTCVLQLSPLGPQVLTPQQFLPNFPAFAEQAHDQNQQLNWTQEIRAQSNDASSRFTWVAGVFFQNAKSTDQDFVPLDAATFTRVSQALGALQNPPLTFASYSDLFYGASLINNVQTYQTLDLVREKQTAGFADLTYELSNGLKFTGGVRITHLNIQSTSIQGGPFAGTSDLEGFSAGQAQTATTPKASVTWQIDPERMVYAAAGKGFRGGGVNQPLPTSCDAALKSQGLSGSPDQYQSDDLWSYEIGSKNRLFENRLDLSASVFYIKWKDIQQSVYLGQGCNRAVTLNANNATSKGFDLQGTWAATGALTVNGAVSYTKATYDEPLQGSPDPVTGLRPIVINQGNTLAGVVPWTVALGGAYSANLFGYDSVARLDGQFTSRQGEAAPQQDPATTSYLPHSLFIPQIIQINARYSVKFGRVELAGFVSNLLDAHPSIQTSAGDQFNSVTQSYTIRPRTVGATISYRYQPK